MASLLSPVPWSIAIAALSASATAQTQLFRPDWIGQPWSRSPVTADRGASPAAGDLNGDGVLDLYLGLGPLGEDETYIVPGPDADPLDQVWLGSPAGRFRVHEEQSSAHANARVVLGDLDGDADLDLLAANCRDRVALGSVGLAVLANDGRGVFDLQWASSAGIGSFDTDRTVLGDLDGDGDLDGILLGTFEDRPRLFANNGLGGMTETPAVFVPPADGTRSLLAVGPFEGCAISDLDLDGRSDLVLSVAGGGALELDLGTGVPFAFRSNSLLTGSGGELFVDDLDADGQPDIVGTRLLLLGQGGGRFRDASGGLPGAGVDGALFVDLDEDGRRDLVGPELFWRNAGDGSFTDASEEVDAFTRDMRLAAGDFDGDGHMDLVGLQPPEANSSLETRQAMQAVFAFGNGRGEFFELDRSQQRMDDSRFRLRMPATLLDVDGDGDLDLFCNEHNVLDFAARTALHENDGSGRFSYEAGATAQVFNSPLLAATTGDLNGDGSADLLIGMVYINQIGGGGAMAVLNDGAGSLSSTNVVHGWSDASVTHLELADFDLDGDLDGLVVLDEQDGGAGLLHLTNDGTAAFAEDFFDFSGPPNDDFNALVAADFDGDGRAEVATTRDSEATLYRYDPGTLAFVDVPGALPEPALALDAGDLDGDGDQDLVASPLDQTGWLWENDGTGLFLARTGPGYDTARPYGHVAALDLDADGGEDALFWETSLFPSPTPHQVVLLARGDGSFASAELPLPLDLSRMRKSGIGDVDGDGDPDFFTGREQHAGLGRHLWLQSPPSLGDPVTFRVWGPANEPVVLAGALGEVRLPLPGLGLLQLDPATLVLLDSGTVGPDRETTLTFTAPADLSLAGQTGYWQALVGSAPHVTNQERAPLLDFF